MQHTLLSMALRQRLRSMQAKIQELNAAIAALRWGVPMQQPPTYVYVPPPHQAAYFMPTPDVPQTNKKQKSPQDGATIDWSKFTQGQTTLVPQFRQSHCVDMAP